MAQTTKTFTPSTTDNEAAVPGVFGSVSFSTFHTDSSFSVVKHFTQIPLENQIPAIGH